MVGDSNATGSESYVPSAGVRSWHDRGLQHNILRMTGYAMSPAQQSMGSPQPQDKAFYYGSSGQTIQTIHASFLPTIIADHGGHADSTLVVVYCGGNNLAAGASAAATLAAMQAFLNDIIAAGLTPLVFTIRPRLYFTSGPDERVILPIRLDYNSQLIDWCDDQGIMCVDVGNDHADAGNPGYADAAYYDNVRPGHYIGASAALSASKAVTIIQAHEKYPEGGNSSWLTQEYKERALNYALRTGGGNANGNAFLTGTGTEGSPVVCAGARMSVLSGSGQVWTWSQVTLRGETWYRLNITANNGTLAFRSQNTGTAAFFALSPNYASATDTIFGVAEVEADPSVTWAFTKFNFQLVANTLFTTTIGQNQAVVGPVLPAYPVGNVLVTPPMISGGSGLATGASFEIVGTGAVFMRFVGVMRLDETLPGPLANMLPG